MQEKYLPHPTDEKTKALTSKRTAQGLIFKWESQDRRPCLGFQSAWYLISIPSQISSDWEWTTPTLHNRNDSHKTNVEKKKSDTKAYYMIPFISNSETDITNLCSWEETGYPCRAEAVAGRGPWRDSWGASDGYYTISWFWCWLHGCIQFVWIY